MRNIIVRTMALIISVTSLLLLSETTSSGEPEKNTTIKTRNNLFTLEPPGGMTFESRCDGIMIRKLSYNQENNYFLINGRTIYKLPLGPIEMAEIFRMIDQEDYLSYPLQKSHRRKYVQTDKTEKIAGVMKICYDYFSNIVFGRPDHLPVGMKLLPESVLKVNDVESSSKVCVNINFRYSFIVDRNSLRRRACNVEINLLPPDSLRKTDSLWDNMDIKLTEKYKEPKAYQDNAVHLTGNMKYYLKNKIVERVVSYGEAAAFARTLKRQYIDLTKIADHLSATQVARSTTDAEIRR